MAGHMDGAAALVNQHLRKSCSLAGIRKSQLGAELPSREEVRRQENPEYAEYSTAGERGAGGGGGRAGEAPSRGIVPNTHFLGRLLTGVEKLNAAIDAPGTTPPAQPLAALPLETASAASQRKKRSRLEAVIEIKRLAALHGLQVVISEADETQQPAAKPLPTGGMRSAAVEEREPVLQQQQAGENGSGDEQQHHHQGHQQQLSANKRGRDGGASALPVKRLKPGVAPAAEPPSPPQAKAVKARTRTRTGSGAKAQPAEEEKAKTAEAKAKTAKAKPKTAEAKAKTAEARPRLRASADLFKFAIGSLGAATPRRRERGDKEKP